MNKFYTAALFVTSMIMIVSCETISNEARQKINENQQKIEENSPPILKPNWEYTTTIDKIRDDTVYNAKVVSKVDENLNIELILRNGFQGNRNEVLFSLDRGSFLIEERKGLFSNNTTYNTSKLTVKWYYKVPKSETGASYTTTYIGTLADDGNNPSILFIDYFENESFIKLLKESKSIMLEFSMNGGLIRQVEINTDNLQWNLK